MAEYNYGLIGIVGTLALLIGAGGTLVLTDGDQNSQLSNAYYCNTTGEFGIFYGGLSSTGLSAYPYKENRSGAKLCSGSRWAFLNESYNMVQTPVLIPPNLTAPDVSLYPPVLTDVSAPLLEQVDENSVRVSYSYEIFYTESYSIVEQDSFLVAADLFILPQDFNVSQYIVDLTLANAVREFDNGFNKSVRVVDLSDYNPLAKPVLFID